MSGGASENRGANAAVVRAGVLFLGIGLLAVVASLRSGSSGSSSEPPPAPGTAERGSAAAGRLTEQERATIRVFQQASKSVVSVANRALFRDFFSLEVFEVPQGSGSGLVWDRDGHIVSNYHVVHQGQTFQVSFGDGATYEAALVGADPDHDLAVLRVSGVPAEKLAPVPLGSSKRLEVGQRVLAIGNPFGLDTSLSVGVVSSLGRTIRSQSNRSIHDVIQTDAAINPGNSGGPLLDSSGYLIGINTAIVSPSGGSVGIGFAVPVDTVARIVPQLIAYGRVKRVGLGIVMLPDRIAARYRIEGVAVVRVVPGGGAARAGLEGMRRTWTGGVELGDIIVGIEDEPVGSQDDLFRLLDVRKAGETVTVKYLRGDETREAPVVLQELRR